MVTAFHRLVLLDVPAHAYTAGALSTNCAYVRRNCNTPYLAYGAAQLRTTIPSDRGFQFGPTKYNRGLRFEFSRFVVILFFLVQATSMGSGSPFHETDGDYRTEKFMERAGGKGATLPLYCLQDALPRLPVPSLEETFARYLVSVEAVASPEEYQRTVAAAGEFLGPGGLVRTR